MTYFVISVLTLNIILWIVLLVRFKKLFSTDNIIEETKKKYNEIVKEIDMAADRDTYLARETTRRIQTAIDDAEKKMEMFKEATDRLREMIAEADKINHGQVSQLSHAIKKAQTMEQQLDPDMAYELSFSNSQLNSEVSNNKSNERMKSDDVYKKPQNYVSSIQKDQINITPDGAAYKEIPLIITKVYDDEPKKISPEDAKKNMSKQIKNMYDEGFSVEQIAKSLNCSVTEVQFTIDML